VQARPGPGRPARGRKPRESAPFRRKRLQKRIECDSLLPTGGGWQTRARSCKEQPETGADGGSTGTNMSDTGDLERITALEERITSALDRISQGLAGAGGADATALAEARQRIGQLEEAKAADKLRIEALSADAEALAAARKRVGELEKNLADDRERIEALTGELEALASETGGGRGDAELRAAREAERTAHSETTRQLRALEEARRADTDEAARAARGQNGERDELRAALEHEQETVADLRVRLDAAEADRPEGGEVDEAVQVELEALRSTEDVLRRRITRLREERNVVREERDSLREQLDDASDLVAASAGDSADPQAELRQMRAANQDLRDGLDELREEFARGGHDPDLIAAALSAELETLKAERAADAAEARAILSEMRPMLEGGAGNA